MENAQGSYDVPSATFSPRKRTEQVSSRKRTLLSKRFADLAATRLSEVEFSEKKCARFCPEKAKPNICQCGLEEIKHDSDVLGTEVGDEWNTEACTSKREMRCYGSIRFKHADAAQSSSSYVRISNDCDMDLFVSHIHKKWNLKKPSLIISVTGGANDFAMPKKDMEKLRNGLRRVVATKGAWVVTGGTDAGIMKVCGEAVRDHLLSSGVDINEKKEVVTMAIASWGACTGKDDYLTPPEGHQLDYDATYERPSKGAGLDPNHTHFVLVDDGTTGKFGREQKFRGTFERTVCENGVRGRKGTKVPIVCVMVEGGPGTIDTVRQALINNTPCVVIDGSKRAADVLAYAVKLVTKEHKPTPEELTELIKIKAKQVLGGRDLDKNVKWIEECLEHVDKIRVFKLDEDNDDQSTGDLDKAILLTLLEVGGLEVKEQIELAVLWNRPDMAEQVLKENKDSIDHEDIKDFATKSLIDNKIEFIKLFLERINLHQFLTRRKLEELYNETLKVSTEYFLLKSLESHEGKVHRGHRDIETIEKVLLSKYNVYYRPDYLRITSTESAEERNSVETAAIKFRKNKNKISAKDEECELELTFKRPERELFVFSLLFIRLECSQYFWDDMLSKTAAALFAAHLSKEILHSPVAKVDNNMSEKVQETLDTYQFKARGILNECYLRNYKYTKTILRASHPPWGKKTCLELAHKADSKEFIALSGCQKLILEVWHGNLSDNNPTWKIVFASLFPPAIIALIWFKADVEQEKQELIDNRKQLKADDPQKGLNTENEENAYKGESFEKEEIPLETSTKNISGWKKIKYFYQAPQVTFILNICTTLIFLGLFSWVNIKGLRLNSPRNEEYVIFFWIFTLFCEELRQMLLLQEPTLWKRFKLFFSDEWNIVDTCAIASFIPGFIMRFGGEESLIPGAHVMYVISLMFYFIRFTSVFAMHNQLGPKIVMIGKMIKDLVYFMCISLVYIFAYGIAVQALVYPNVTDPSFSVLWGVFFRPFFEMIGEPSLEDIGANDKCESEDDFIWPYEHCPEQGNITVFALFLKAFYLLFTNVLLLNLLIAMFNYRYTEVNDQSTVYWKFQMFNVIQEYFNRPKFPPPLLFISHCYMVIMATVKREFPKAKKLVEEPKEHILRQLEKWEDISAKEFSMQTEREKQENMEERVKKIELKTSVIDRSIASVQADVNKNSDTIMRTMSENQLKSAPPPPTEYTDKLEETKRTLARELTVVRENNDDLGLQIRTLGDRTSRLEGVVVKVDDRCRHMEAMLEMLVKSMARGEPIVIEDLEEQR